MKKVELISLYQNKITEMKGLELTILDLSNNKISEIKNVDTIKKLEKFSQFGTLHLQGNKISIKSLNHFKQQFQKLRIS